MALKSGTSVIRRFGIALGGLAVVILALFVVPVSGPREPVFEGRKLTSWLDHHVPSSAADPPYGSPGFKKAEETILRIGTNGIPTLLKMAASRDYPRPIIRLLDKARQYRWTTNRYHYASARHDEAEYAFRLLGTNAASAVPGLIRIYERNISPSSRRCAAMSLGNIGRAAQAAGPVLMRDFSHTNKETRFCAVSAMLHIGGDPAVVVPALTRVLDDPDINVRWNALVALSIFGSRARAAVPAIQKRLTDDGKVGTSTIHAQVELALWRVAPEKLPNAFVVEEATPIISNGVTTQAVKILYEGQRKVLVPSGNTVPTLRQYWNSDPRSHLTLFRGTPEPGAEDNFLGTFQVMDLPAEENLNISTLCVIADGRIWLCARDNHREAFLGIRRVDNGKPPEK